MPTHITLDTNESHVLIGFLLKVAGLARTIGNLALAAVAESMADLILDKWLPEGGHRA